MTQEAWHEQVAADWAEALAPMSGHLAALGTFLRQERAHGRGFLPAGPDILRAFTEPMERVRVLLVGQDPYPTPGHAMGLAFSVARNVRPLPGSLRNILTEWQADLGLQPPGHGDLSAWQRRGVLLLNRVLTVTPGSPGSHHGRGWEEITAHAVQRLVARGGPLVAVLWGAQAQTLRPLLGAIPVVASAHPSPLSAHRGFLGSRPFSAVNAHLEAQDAPAVDWSLDG